GEHEATLVRAVAAGATVAARRGAGRESGSWRLKGPSRGYPWPAPPRPPGVQWLAAADVAFLTAFTTCSTHALTIRPSLPPPQPLPGTGNSPARAPPVRPRSRLLAQRLRHTGSRLPGPASDRALLDCHLLYGRSSFRVGDTGLPQGVIVQLACQVCNRLLSAL